MITSYVQKRVAGAGPQGSPGERGLAHESPHRARRPHAPGFRSWRRSNPGHPISKLVCLAFLTLTVLLRPASVQAADVLTGIDVLQRDDFAPLAGKRIGLITNHTGVNKDGVSTVTILHEAAGGALRDLDRLATSCLRVATRKKRKTIERDVVSRVVKAPAAEVQ